MRETVCRSIRGSAAGLYLAPVTSLLSAQLGPTMPVDLSKWSMSLSLQEMGKWSQHLQDMLGRGSVSWAECWCPPRLRAGPPLLRGLALMQVHTTPWSWQIHMLPAGRTPNTGSGTIFWWSVWRAVPSAVTQLSPVTLALSLSRAQAFSIPSGWFTSRMGHWHLTSPFSATDQRLPWQIQSGVFHKKFQLRSPVADMCDESGVTVLQVCEQLSGKEGNVREQSPRGLKQCSQGHWYM